jgi:hypothetical protein
MHPEMMRALAIDRQRYLLESAERVSRPRRSPRPARPSSTQRHGRVLGRVGAVLRPPTL